MIKKVITYTDYDGNSRTETHYFNLSKAELIKMQASSDGGYDKKLMRIVESQNTPAIMNIIEDIITRSHGVKSDDGKRFVKNHEITESFIQSEAYSELLVELLSDADKAAAFMRGIMPADVSAEIDKHPEMMTFPNAQ